MVRYSLYPSSLCFNICRAILHDPVVFPEPDSFKPERFINPDGSFRDDPVVSSIFGFRKWICPGRHLADAMMFIVVASFLSVFNIEKGNDTDDGSDMYPYTGDWHKVQPPCLISGVGDLERAYR